MEFKSPNAKLASTYQFMGDSDSNIPIRNYLHTIYVIQKCIAIPEVRNPQSTGKPLIICVRGF